MLGVILPKSSTAGDPTRCSFGIGQGVEDLRVFGQKLKYGSKKNTDLVNMVRIRALNFDRMRRELRIKGHRLSKMLSDELRCDPPLWENSAMKGQLSTFHGMVLATYLSENQKQKVRSIQKHRKPTYSE